MKFRLLFLSVAALAWAGLAHAAGYLPKMMPADEMIFLVGQITVGHTVTASGHYTQIVLDQP